MSGRCVFSHTVVNVSIQLFFLIAVSKGSVQGWKDGKCSVLYRGPMLGVQSFFFLFKKLHGKSSAHLTHTSLSHVQMKKKVHLLSKQLFSDLKTTFRLSSFLTLITVRNAQNKRSEEIRKRIKAGNSCCYANKKLLSNKLLNYNSKIQIYKTIIRPTAIYGCETWVLTASDEKQLYIFERFMGQCKIQM